MRFEISYPGGTTHEVELGGNVCVVGRDPGCDIVLNDSKCSRRHAVVEEGPGGVTVRDSGSANGIFVNGRKVEKAPLRPGDTVRLGDVKLRLLAEIGETVVMAPDGMTLEPGPGGPVALDTADQPLPAPAPALAGPTPSPRAPATPPVPAAAEPRAAARPAKHKHPPLSPRAQRGPARPATVSLLAGLWALFVPLAVAGALLAAARLQAGWAGWAAAGVLALVFAGLGTTMALGLRALAVWARHLQLATAAVGLLVCPFTLAAATVLLYMSRPEVKAAFEGTAAGQPPDSAEPTFALSLVGMLLLGLALSAVGLLVL
jgi:hypothetical protein